MQVICNKITKKIEVFSQYDDLRWDSVTQVSLQIGYTPDTTTERLNATNDGLDTINQAAIDIEIDVEKTAEADIELVFDSTLKAFALVVLDEINILRTQAGLPSRTVQQLKTAIKAKL